MGGPSSMPMVGARRFEPPTSAQKDFFREIVILCQQPAIQRRYYLRDSDDHIQ